MRNADVCRGEWTARKSSFQASRRAGEQEIRASVRTQSVGRQSNGGTVRSRHSRGAAPSPPQILRGRSRTHGEDTKTATRSPCLAISSRMPPPPISNTTRPTGTLRVVSGVQSALGGSVRPRRRSRLNQLNVGPDDVHSRRCTMGTDEALQVGKSTNRLALLVSSRPLVSSRLVSSTHLQAQYSKPPFPLPILVSFPFTHTGTSGNTRKKHSAPFTGLIFRLIATWAEVSWLAVSLVDARTRRPKVPCSSDVPLSEPPVGMLTRPFWALRYFVRRGASWPRNRTWSVPGVVGSGENDGSEGSSTREVEAKGEGRRREESGERRPSMAG